MNYARAAKGRLSRSYVLRQITSQSELEIGRPLTKAEEEVLFVRFSPHTIMERIEKVGKYIIFNFLMNPNFSMDMVP